MHLLSLLLTFLFLNLTIHAHPVIETRQESTTDFALTVWKNHPRDPKPFYGSLDIESNGDAIFNRTATPKDYRYAFTGAHPGPSAVYQRGTGKLAYLQPTELMGHYQLKFAKTLPSRDCILFDKWTRQYRMCGGHCGGIDLRWDSLGQDSPIRGGEFYIVPHRSIPNAWHVRYALTTLPENGIAFIMFT